MLNETLFCNGHLTPLAFLLLESDALDDKEKELLLFHIIKCDKCMQEYTQSLTEELLIEPPSGLEQKIIKAVEVEYEKKRNSKILSVQFVKLAIAVCITMVMLIGGVFDYIGNVPNEMMKEKPQKNQKACFITQLGQDFSQAFNDFAYSFNNSMYDKKEQNKNDKLKK